VGDGLQGFSIFAYTTGDARYHVSGIFNPLKNKSVPPKGQSVAPKQQSGENIFLRGGSRLLLYLIVNKQMG
jgi:hypothetical protein